MNELDKLLCEPIAAIADEGFSARVIRRVQIERLRREWKTIAALALCVVLLFALLPLHTIGALLGAGVPLLAGGWQLSLGVWLVVVSLIGAYQLSRL